jgi:hypothetical protein
MLLCPGSPMKRLGQRDFLGRSVNRLDIDLASNPGYLHKRSNHNNGRAGNITQYFNVSRDIAPVDCTEEGNHTVSPVA